MRVGRLLLLAGCFGWIAGGCESDLKLELDGLRCSDEDRCSQGYACDRASGFCVRNEPGQEPVPVAPDAGDAGHAMGGGGSGHGGVAGNAGSAGLGGQGGGGGSTSDLDAGSYPIDGGDACVPTTVYRDNDNDGFGDEDTSKLGCPGNGWVIDGTDCRDDIVDVRPNQTGFFGISYFTPTGPSFDYDCSGAEEPSPNNNTNDPAPACSGVGLGGCVGSGFLSASEPPRAGSGVDPRCGSTLRRDCDFDGLLNQCQAVDTPLDDDLTFLCH